MLVGVLAVVLIAVGLPPAAVWVARHTLWARRHPRPVDRWGLRRAIRRNEDPGERAG